MGIKTEASQRIKVKFEKLVKDAGYKSMRAFAKDVNINIGNIYSNLDGTYNMSINRMFKIAKMLGVPIAQVIAIFYPKEYAENQSYL